MSTLGKPSKETIENKAIVRTCLGWIIIGFTKKGITSLTFPSSKKPLIQEYSLPSFVKEIKSSLKKYFLGEQIKFNCSVDLRGFDGFALDVWKKTMKIPYGKLETYKSIAAKVKNAKACRAVGNALGKNPIPIIIPCHRVISSNGNIGGFSGGIKWKRLLLKIEGKGTIF